MRGRERSVLACALLPTPLGGYGAVYPRGPKITHFPPSERLFATHESPWSERGHEGVVITLRLASNVLAIQLDPSEAPTIRGYLDTAACAPAGSVRSERLMTTAERHVGQMEARLRHLGAKLDELAAKVERGSAEVQAERRKSIDDLKAKHAAAHAKLEEFRAAGNDKWDHFKTGIERAWNELERAVKSLKH